MATKLGQKRKSPKKPIKRKHSSLKLSLDILFSKYIRARADNTCEFCGEKGKQTQCHHGVVHRRYMNTRYVIDNCACVCIACHNFLSDFPAVNIAFFVKRIGTDRVEQLGILARSGKGNAPDLEAIEAELKAKLKGLE